MESKRPEASRVESTHIVLPSHTNNHGSAFGGQICAWVDITAAVSAQRFSAGPVVTVSMDQLTFKRPVRKGDVVTLTAGVNQAWRTSMEIGVEVWGEDPITGVKTHCCTAYLTFVALDRDGRPRPIPKLDVGGDPEASRVADQADQRRQHRLATRD